MSDNKETTTTTPVEEKKETTTAAAAPVEEKKETPSIFGSAFTGTAPAATTTAAASESKEENAPVYEPNVEFAPKLNLTKQETKTNEEDEEVLVELRAKLYRYVTDPQPQWNERGVGLVKLLKHQTTKKIRISMRREKVFKVCLNHYVAPHLKLEANQGNDKSWVWRAKDFSDEEKPEGVDEMFAIRFGSPENANTFKEHFEKAQQEMKELSEKSQ